MSNSNARVRQLHAEKNSIVELFEARKNDDDYADCKKAGLARIAEIDKELHTLEPNYNGGKWVESAGDGK